MPNNTPGDSVPYYTVSFPPPRVDSPVLVRTKKNQASSAISIETHSGYLLQRRVGSDKTVEIGRSSGNWTQVLYTGNGAGAEFSVKQQG